ncbi:HNH endonuclease [Haloferula sp. A504]|uniref:HNH endonuclease n=1 Tax=Haloferula sp. A504 TaxID=3373601 RepID=UPI0031C8D445|nr:HNH endonuclease [Verrucomicrobiaceae bacterium E54]
MFLHTLSKKVCAEFGLTVGDQAYTEHVSSVFKDKCIYCQDLLEKDKLAVEHLDGMNRMRAGLHIPGNVAVSCRKCNSEKRRDDQAKDLIHPGSGWMSFLSHDETRCKTTCKTCAFWAGKFPESQSRVEYLFMIRTRISGFRDRYKSVISWNMENKDVIRNQSEKLYRLCQEFATKEIKDLADQVNVSLGSVYQATSRLKRSG